MSSNNNETESNCPYTLLPKDSTSSYTHVTNSPVITISEKHFNIENSKEEKNDVDAEERWEQYQTILKRKREEPWLSGGLFNCFSDMPSCVHAFFCSPCCVPIYLSEMNGNDIVMNFCHSDICSFRYEVREKYNVNGNICTDCIINAFCLCCSNAQAMREIKKRGPISKSLD